MKISATIITYNEEKQIGACIDSLHGVADEIVVVDSYSTDRTTDIVESKGARVIKNKFSGHIEQKNFALDQLKYDCVLSLDADEVLSPELIKTIKTIKENWNADAYMVNRKNFFCGKWISHGLWYPDRKIRLWNRKKGCWGGKNPHDKVVMEPGCRVKKIEGDLLHYTVSEVGEYLAQVDKFSTIQAEQLKAEGMSPHFFHLRIKPLYKFLLAYVIRLGFLDGWRGYVIARGQALGIYWRYRKVREMT